MINEFEKEKEIEATENFEYTSEIKDDDIEKNSTDSLDTFQGDNLEEKIDEKIGVEEGEVEEEKEEVGEEIEEEVEKVEEDMVLYLLIDRPVRGLMEYIRCLGINLSNIFNSIHDIRNAVLMQSNKCRIVVADTGMGKFTSTKNREELTDMLGICDENTRISVFYTDSIIKTDTIRELGKGKIDIDWFKYKGTVYMVADIMEYGEKYILDYDSDELEKPIEFNDLFNVKGVECESTVNNEIDVTSNITVQEVIDNMLNKDTDLLPKYEVNI